MSSPISSSDSLTYDFRSVHTRSFYFRLRRSIKGFFHAGCEMVGFLPVAAGLHVAIFWANLLSPTSLDALSLMKTQIMVSK